MAATPDDNGGYQRGFVDGVNVGRVSQQLTEFATHFTEIEKTLGKIEQSIQALQLETARQDQRAIGEAATVKTTAGAVEKARAAAAATVEETRAARQDQSEQRWSPWAKLIAVLAAVGGVVVVVLAVYAATRPG